MANESLERAFLATVQGKSFKRKQRNFNKRIVYVGVWGAHVV